MNILKCPVDLCPVETQRTPTGTLVDGLVLHLRTVHDYPESRARPTAIHTYQLATATEPTP